MKFSNWSNKSKSLKIYDFPKIESYEKIFALSFFIVKKYWNFLFSSNTFSSFSFFYEIYKKVGIFFFYPLFLVFLKTSSLEYTQNTSFISQVLKIFWGAGVWENFRKNWNLEKIQFSFFGSKIFFRIPIKFLIEEKKIDSMKKSARIFFSNYPKVDVKTFQLQIFFWSRLIANERKLSESSFFVSREVSNKLLGAFFCIGLGKYMIKIFFRLFNISVNLSKPLHFFYLTLLSAKKEIKKKKIQIKKKTYLSLLKKMIWVDKNNKKTKINRTIRIKKSF